MVTNFITSARESIEVVKLCFHKVDLDYKYPEDILYFLSQPYIYIIIYFLEKVKIYKCNVQLRGILQFFLTFQVYIKV